MHVSMYSLNIYHLNIKNIFTFWFVRDSLLISRDEGNFGFVSSSVVTKLYLRHGVVAMTRCSELLKLDHLSGNEELLESAICR